jgi:multicomponent Na+:H+ antiporter subunit B
MTSIILRSVAHVLVPLQLVFSLFLLLRGHNEPGGGFAAALVVGAALALHSIAHSPEETRRLLRIEPVSIAGLGLFVALLAGAFGLASGEQFLAGQWSEIDLVVFHLEFGTPLLFDVGVYLLVIGVVTAVLLTLMEGR